MYSNEYSQAFFCNILYNFFMKVFAERLKELRLEKELSQRGLAKLLNLSAQAVSQWENESRTPNAEAVAVIAKFFGVSADYLLGLED